MVSTLRIQTSEVALLKARLESGRALLAAELKPQSSAQSGGRSFVRGLSELIDDMTRSLAHAALTGIEATYGAEGRASAQRVAVLALGGYGRRELCPASDIDLMFLVPSSALAEPERAFVDQVLYGMWDLGLEVGHGVRTVGESVELGFQDQAVRTALLEARLIRQDDEGAAGRELAFEEFDRRVSAEFLSGSAAENLIEAKLEEAQRRRERYGDSVYLLEPEVKMGRGGLRDVHTALWVARARWRARDLSGLLTTAVLSPEEEHTLMRSYSFLLRVRTELHLLAGRRRDSLGFEYQEAIAKRLGYRRDDDESSKSRRHGTERFMRAYYFHAAQAQRISSLIVERATSHRIARPSRVFDGPSGFKLFAGKLTLSGRQQLERDPGATMRLFRVAQEENLEIYSYTKDLVRAALDRFGAQVRRAPNVVSDFLSLLENPSGDGSILDLLHELGVLRRMIPEIARVTARWQHSLYHVYTVDVHSIYTVKLLKRLRLGAFVQEQPELTRLLSELPRPQVLYMGALLHDIGKGWTRGDHSRRGAIVAATVGARFSAAKVDDWSENETEDLVWLVEKHLLMSDLSQRRDLSDRDLVVDFAAECRSVERLTMLYLLTFADMKATSPKVWNSWKASLLRELYVKARDYLVGQDESSWASHTEQRRQRVVKDIAVAAPNNHRVVEVADRFTQLMPARYLFAFSGKHMIPHIEAWRSVSAGGEIAIHLRHHRKENRTEVMIVCPDRAGLLALIAGSFAANGVPILAAHIFSIERCEGPGSKLALDLIDVRNESGALEDRPDLWVKVESELRQVLAGELDVEGLLSRRLGTGRLSKFRPAVETQVVVAEDASRTDTVIDVYCQDHLGVLHTIARAFLDQGLSINLAKVSTQGDRVADGFYLTDRETGKKVEDPARLRQVVHAVRAAIERTRSNGSAASAPAS